MTQFVEINGNLYRVVKNQNWTMTGFEEKSKQSQKKSNFEIRDMEQEDD